MNKAFFIISVLTVLMISTVYPIKHHTIYISGPPVITNNNWFKESRYIYSGLKKEIIEQDNSIKLFPKKRYRDSIIRNTRLRGKHIRSRSMSKKRLLRRYLDLDGLMKELMELILVRRDEIVAKNFNSDGDVWDTRIHLRSHSNGDILISMLIDGGYGELLGSLVSIDGNEYVSDTQVSSISEIITSDPANSRGICNGETIINITINDLENLADTSGCLHNNETTLGIIGAMLGIIGAILALL